MDSAKKSIIVISFAFLFKGFYQYTPREDELRKVLLNDNENNVKYNFYESNLIDNFKIETSGCTIPTFDYSEPRIKSFVHHSSREPTCDAAHPLLGNNETHIWVIKKNLRYFKWKKDDIRCCYSGIELDLDRKNAAVGSFVKYKECVTFQDIVPVRDEFVRVSCNMPYEQFFIFTPKRFFIKTQRPSYNVLILGLRSVSRQDFHRTMPNTLSFLKKKKAIDMIGYNQVSENGILMHVLGVLSGLNEHKLRKTCLPSPVSTVDKCQLIWERFQYAGYYTALMEDSARNSVFNLNNDGYYGFSGKPTDYYIHPILKEAEKSAQKFKSLECMGDKYSFQVILDYLQSLVTTLKSDKLFGVFWESSISNTHLNHPMLMDNSYESFLKKLDRSGYLNETIIFLMSDQDVKSTETYKTKQGQLENRQPFLNILLPSSFRRKFSVAYDYLRANSQRLSTPYDMYNTLLDLIDLNGLKNEEILLRSTLTRPHDKRFSLFAPIPANRTCATANISSSLCICFQSQEIEKNSMKARGSTVFLINYINNILSPYHQCARLKVDVTIQAVELMVSYEKYQDWRDVTVTVSVSPGGGIFEGTVRNYKRGGWSMVSIRRLNPIDENTGCVHHERLKIYCHCNY